MKQGKLLSGLIIGTFVLYVLISQILFRVYGFSLLLSENEDYIVYTRIATYSAFFLTNTFYIIVLKVFPEHKSLSTYALLMIIVSFSFNVLYLLEHQFVAEAIIVRVYIGVSFFLGFASLILATYIVLEESHNKIVTVSLVYFSIITLIFGTPVTTYFRSFLLAVFGNDAVVVINNVYDISILLLQGSVVALQVLSILSLLSIRNGLNTLVRKI
jgi:hypothetical protein